MTPRARSANAKSCNTIMSRTSTPPASPLSARRRMLMDFMLLTHCMHPSARCRICSGPFLALGGLGVSQHDKSTPEADAGEGDGGRRSPHTSRTVVYLVVMSGLRWRVTPDAAQLEIRATQREQITVRMGEQIRERMR